MEVIVLVPGPYSDYNNIKVNGRLPAKKLSRGDVVNFPQEYAEECIRANLVAQPDAASKLLQEIEADLGTEEVNISEAALGLIEENEIDLDDLVKFAQSDNVTVHTVRAYLKDRGEVNELSE